MRNRAPQNCVVSVLTPLLQRAFADSNLSIQVVPIICISSHELHVNDPDYYDFFLSGASTKRDRPQTWSHASLTSILSLVQYLTTSIVSSAAN
jgi:hypothetical protein